MCRRFSYGYKPVVAVSCVLCGIIVPGKFHKRLCNDCRKKWCRVTPWKIVEELNEYGSSGRPLPKDLRVWERIIRLRKLHIYNIYDI